MSPEALTKVLKSHQLWLDSGGQEGEKANFEGADLQGADLQNAVLNGAAFKNANLIAANLQGAQLREASFDRTRLEAADLRNAKLKKAEFKNAILTKTNLQGAHLQGASFGGAHLRRADLRNALLEEAVFKDAELIETNLQGGQLRRTSFDGAILRRANLREADLENANLENAQFLLSSQLAGSNVAGAKLPAAIAEFNGLETIAEATSNAQKLFVAMLGGCLYSWLTIGTTKDAALLTNSASSPLPIIGTELPIVGFYTVAPIVLLSMYFYFHLNMQRLWEALADLPAVFPDGRTLDKRADPWLLNGLVGAHFVRLRRQRPPLSRVQQWLSILLAWWVVPVTLFVFWGRFLARHDWLGTSLHIGLLAAAIGFGWMSYRLARATLQGAPRVPFPWRLSWVCRRKSWRQLWKDRRRHWRQVWQDRRAFRRVAGILGMCAVGVIFYYISLSAIEDDRSIKEDKDRNHARKFVLRILRHVGFSPFANLIEEDISTKPPNWTGDPKEYALVKGANLRAANMQHADARHAFLVNADLSNANLTGADLSKANLSNAKLIDANLSDALLVATNLSYATLNNANCLGARAMILDLSNANLTGANFSNAFLRRSNLSNAQLHQAIFSNADLTRSNLSKAGFRGADLSGATLSGADLSGADLSLAVFSHAILKDANLEGANLDLTHLAGVDLSQVKGLTMEQIRVALTDKKTLFPANLPP